MFRHILLFQKQVHAMCSISKLLFHYAFWTIFHVNKYPLCNFKRMYNMYHDLKSKMYNLFLFLQPYKNVAMNIFVLLLHTCPKISQDIFPKLAYLSDRIDMLYVLIHIAKLSSIKLAPMYEQGMRNLGFFKIIME